VTAEGSETPGGGPGSGAQFGGLGPEGRGRGTEGDLLAERRARRAVESGDAALIRRAETAEATVRTLEAHVTSLQQRLREAEEQERRTSQSVPTERGQPVIDRRSSSEQELRRAKQREYAEQQLRVEAEDRCIDLEREGRLEVERLGRRLSASERGARELARQLESVQRELAEAEQTAAAELAAVRRAEQEFHKRLAELERRAVEIHGGLQAERAGRERAEQQLESMRRAHRRVEGLVVELRSVVARLRATALAASPGGEPTPAWPGGPDRAAGRHEPSPAAWTAPQGAHREQMTEALAAAVERLRARVEDVGADAGEGHEPQPGPPGAKPQTPPAAAAGLPAHKHSMSWLARRAIRRKQRRERRAAAAPTPSMQSQ
jgi:hypothetical protein